MNIIFNEAHLSMRQPQIYTRHKIYPSYKGLNIALCFVFEITKTLFIKYFLSWLLLKKKQKCDRFMRFCWFFLQLFFFIYLFLYPVFVKN